MSILRGFSSVAVSIPIFLSTFLGAHPAEAGRHKVSCEKLLRIDTQKLALESEGRGIYFNRWSLPRGILYSDVLQALITKAKGPVLLFDTNPAPELWGEYNLVRPDALTSTSKFYQDLTSVEKASIFEAFATRLASSRGKSVFIIDHHFDFKLLAKTSSTPLILDFLDWLDQQAEQSLAQKGRSVLRSAQVLRDHSDADIVLANLALELLDRPAVRLELGPLMRQIALYNDHLYLDPGLSSGQIHQINQGYQLMLAFEKWIERHSPGGFSRALKVLEPALRHIQDHHQKLPKHAMDLKQIFSDFHERAEVDAKLRERIKKMMDKGERVELRRGVLTLHYKVSNQMPSGSDTLRHLLDVAPDVMRLVKALVVIGAEKNENREDVLNFIKIRVVDPDLDLAPVLQEARVFYPGSGGRSGAGSLYPPSGRLVDEAQLNQDILWLENRLIREIETQLPSRH